jgi:hypothetical protein
MPQDPGSFHRLILYVTMVYGDGQPFSEHVATAASTALDKTSLLRHLPVSLPPLDPIKGKAGDSTKGGRRSKSSSHRRRSTSQAISFVLSLSETWDRLSLSQLVTPTQALRCKEIQYFSPLPLDVGPSFARTRIKPSCILFASPSRLGTHSTNSLVGLGPSRDQIPTETFSENAILQLRMLGESSNESICGAYINICSFL